MISRLIELSIRGRFLVCLLALIFVMSGMYVASNSAVDVLPDFAPPQVIIQTEAPGMVAEEVEALVSLPVESALNGAPGIQHVKSISMTGISNITAIFRYGMDIYTCRQLVNERLQLATARFPQGVGAPTMLPIMSVIGDVVKIGLVSEKTSPMELRTLADWDIRNRLMAVPGVSRVLVFGGDQKQFQVLVNPDKLKSYGVSLDDVEKAVTQANVATSGGFLVTPDQQLTIRGLCRVHDVSDLADSVVTSRNDVPILLKHVARVQIGSAFKVGDAIINGQPGVEVVITKQPFVNTVEVTKRIESALAEVKQALPPDIKVVEIFRQATFIEQSIQNVLWAIGTGGVLVVLVLLFFLFNWRTSIISLTAIPASLIAAIITIKLTGETINTMTLGGLAIAVGEVVDDAIVDVENVYKRLRENKLSVSPRPALRVILDACREVRSSVVYATFVVALVFLPIFTLVGVEGQIFRPLAFSYVLATMSSLVVALTLTPAMCAYFLSTMGHIPIIEPPVVAKLKEAYGATLDRVFQMPKLVVAGTVVVFLLSASLLLRMGQAFLPEFQENNVIIGAVGLPGESLEATTRMGIAVERKLIEHKEVVAVGQRAGRTELDDDSGGPNFSEFDVCFRESKRKLPEILDDLRKHLAEVPGVAFDVSSFIVHRMDDILSGGTRAQIAIKIFGPDLAELRALAGQVAGVVKTVPGAVDVKPEAQVLVPEIDIRIDRARAARYGLTAEELSRSIRTAFNGSIVSEVLEKQRLFGLRILFDEEARHNFNQIESTLIDTPSHMRIPLSEVAQVRIADGPSAVIRENVARRIVVQANTHGRDIVGVVEEAKKRIAADVQLPKGYYIEYAGEYAVQQEAVKRLMLTSLLALAGILLLLRQGMPSWKSTILVLSNLPLATIGGILAVAMTGGVISIGSLIGFISLFGISTRNSLLLVTRIDALVEEGYPVERAIYAGALDRLAPVLMTASAAALGMLPLAVLGGSGRELEQPLAVVIVGGLFSSTALTLIVIPALFKLFLPSEKTSTVTLPQEIGS